MMRVTISRNGLAAVAYFDEALSKEDYFFKEKKVNAQWLGKTAKHLGLYGKKVDKSTFSKLVQNINPQTGKRLTMRQNTNRRAGYEYCFNSPKSASVLYALTGDKAIIEAHRYGVRKAMEAIERDMMTQANKGRQKIYKHTGNLIYASFEHLVTRPVAHKKEGKKSYIPDCHIHSHAFVPSVTWVADKNRYQALEEGNIRRQAPYYEAVYHAIYSEALAKAGYEIIRTVDRWEVKGADEKQLLEKFSNRTLEIEALAKAKGVTDVKRKSALGARSRIKKNAGIGQEKLSDIWKARLSGAEYRAIKSAKKEAPFKAKGISTKEAIDRSLSHWLERLSAPQEKRVLAQAMTLGYGHLLPEDLHKELNKRDNLLRSNKRGITHITLKEIVWAEDKMIGFAANGRETVPALHPDYEIQQDFLNKQQREAIGGLLNSTDRVSILKGGAGVGKTSLLIEVKEAIKQTGRSLIAVAPSAQASRGVLRDKGFERADTITSLLQKPELQAQLKGGVLLVDEAGMVGVRTMNKLFEVADKQGARIILSGDIRQHSSVEAGDALRLIEEKAGIQPASVQKIMRQKPQTYKRAIAYLSKGKTLKGYEQLDKMGAIKEIEDRGMRHKAIAENYLNSINKKRSALIVSPTHQEGLAISEVVRQAKRKAGMITGKDRVFQTMRNLSLTQSQKQDIAAYDKGHIIRFHQNRKGGFKAGSHYEVIEANVKGQIKVRSLSEDKAAEILLPIGEHKHFEVYRPDQTALAKGDRIAISANGKSLEQSKLHNQSVYRVEGFTGQGDIRLSNGKTLSKDYRNFRHAYVSTSHAAQGRDAKDVFIAQSAESFGASNTQQFYVSASRGSEQISIYTNDKKELKTAIAQSGERMSANEVASGHYRRQLQKNIIDYHQNLSKPEHEPGQNKLLRSKGTVYRQENSPNRE